MDAAAWGLLVLFLLVLLALAWPLGLWIGRLADGTLPRWMLRAEAPLLRAAGVAPGESMAWWQYASALLAFNAVPLLALYALQRWQGVLPLNPSGFPAVAPDSAFNTAVSFVTNTNWQGYA
ncbi:MAG: potassium-transporting ATPase subunit KdpA, partial [Comamonadaceae bacterium]